MRKKVDKIESHLIVFRLFMNNEISQITIDLTSGENELATENESKRPGVRVIVAIYHSMGD
jgi:hypothetical protein